MEPNTDNIKTGTKKTRTTYDYFSLSVEPNANECYLYGVTDNGTSPYYTLINGATDAVIRIGGVAVEEITGIAYENNNNIIAITSPTDPNFPSKIIRLPISNVNNAVIICSLQTSNLITDIEHDGNGTFYAINRSMAQGDLPIVSVNITTGAISNLPNNPTIPNNPTFTNSEVMGLAFDYSTNDDIYLVVPTGNGQDEEIIKYEIGTQTVTYNPGNYELCADIDANATLGNEMGFHYYYLNGNTHRYIAMSGHYTSPPNDTYFGLPCIAGGTGLSPYSCLKPTVDFCKGN